MTILLGALELLAIHTRAPMLPSPEGADWLREQGMVDTDAVGMTVLTDKGRVWLDMLASTPLPVPTSAWADPRQPAKFPGAPYPPAPSITQVTVPAPILRGNAGSAATLPPQPPGFVPNEHTALKPGEVPANLPRDTEVECIWRNGKRVKNFAGAVIWGHRNSPSDVIYIRVIQPEPLLVAGR